MSEEAAVTFRPFLLDDLNFISNSWGSSYYKGADNHLFFSPDEFHEHHRPIREKFFDNPRGSVIVCCAKETPSLIIGWIAVEKPKECSGMILHYLYVKQAFKSEGIAKELLKRALPTTPVIFTHLTEKASRILDSKRERFKDYYFRPHII